VKAVVTTLRCAALVGLLVTVSLICGGCGSSSSAEIKLPQGVAPPNPCLLLGVDKISTALGVQAHDNGGAPPVVRPDGERTCLWQLADGGVLSLQVITDGSIQATTQYRPANDPIASARAFYGDLLPGTVSAADKVGATSRWSQNGATVATLDAVQDDGFLSLAATQRPVSEDQMASLMVQALAALRAAAAPGVTGTST